MLFFWVSFKEQMLLLVFFQWINTFCLQDQNEISLSENVIELVQGETFNKLSYFNMYANP